MVAMSPDPAERKYSERDVAAILRRAAEIQTSKGELSPRSGSSVQDIEQIGAELGLDPGAIRDAVAEFSSGGSSRQKFLLGGPVGMELDRVFEGEVDDEKWQDIVLAFRKAFGRVGKTSEVGAIREWSGRTSDLDEIHLSVHSKDGNTRVRGLSDLSGALFLTGLTTGLPGFFVTLILLTLRNVEWGVRIALAIGALAGFAAMFRGIFGFMAKRRKIALEGLYERLTEQFEGSPRRQLASQPSPAQTLDEERMTQRQGETT
jgi:hypothetical protein